jgi:hypothetical protein
MGSGREMGEVESGDGYWVNPWGSEGLSRLEPEMVVASVERLSGSLKVEYGDGQGWWRLLVMDDGWFVLVETPWN